MTARPERRLHAVPAPRDPEPGGGAPRSAAEAADWVRGLLGAGLDATPGLADLLGPASGLASESMSGHTLKAYGGAWSRWERWCHERRVPSLPADPAHVAAYAAGLYTGPRPLRPVSVAAHLTALNTVHRLHGLPEPGRAGAVRAVHRGGRRRYGTRPLHAKDALVTALFRRVLAAASAGPGRSRDRAAAALATAGLPPADIARVTWADLNRRTDGSWTVGRPGRRRAVVAARGGPASPSVALDDSRAAAALGDAGPEGAVCATVRGPLTRYGVVLLLRRAARDAGVPLPPTGPPDLTGQAGTQVLAHLAVPRLVERRDTALLLTGWMGAQRRSGLSGLDWGDLRPDTDGEVRVTVRRQKNDQDGAGHDYWLAPGGNPGTCPVAAHDAWRDALATDLGRDPQAGPGTPYLCRIGRDGRAAVGPDGTPLRLGPDAVHEIVRLLCERAGLPAGSFGSHSLRSGWITEAAGTDGVELADIMAVSGHRSADAVLRYVRPVHARRRNPSRRMSL